MKKVLKYLAAALLFSFSVSSHAAKVSDELAHKILTEGEPIDSGRAGGNGNQDWLATFVRFRGEIYFCRITFGDSDGAVRSWCWDKR
jgi:hypothetical protein